MLVEQNSKVIGPALNKIVEEFWAAANASEPVELTL
jgi:hypothetical protein